MSTLQILCNAYLDTLNRCADLYECGAQAHADHDEDACISLFYDLQVEENYLERIMRILDTF